MKNVLFGIIISLLVLIAYLVWVAPLRLPEGKVLVSSNFLDSLAIVANQPPRIEIVVDTFWRDTTIYIEKDPPIPTDEGQYFSYADSIKTPELSFWIWDKISKTGIVENRKTAYRLHVPFRIIERNTIYQPVPMPYPVIQERVIKHNYYIQVGYNFSNTSISGGVGIVRNNYMLGVEGGKNQFEIKGGYQF